MRHFYHPSPPVPEEDVNRSFWAQVRVNLRQFCRITYGVKKWRVTVTGTRHYMGSVEGEDTVIDEPVDVFSDMQAYKELDGVEPEEMPDARWMELFRDFREFSSPFAATEDRPFITIPPALTPFVIISRAAYGKDENEWIIFISGTGMDYMQFTEDGAFEGWTIEDDAAKLVVGEEDFPIKLLISTSEANPTWWSDVSIEVKATEFWAYDEQYPSARWDSETGESITSPFEADED